jgi:hypothetical protein
MTSISKSTIIDIYPQDGADGYPCSNELLEKLLEEISLLA